MLRLSGKQLYNYDNAFQQDEIKVYYTSDNYKYIIIHNSQPYELTKEGSFLVWNIPSGIKTDPIKLKIQCMDNLTNITEYITNEISVKRFESSPGNIIVNNIEYDVDYPVYREMVDEHQAIIVQDSDFIIPSNFPKIVSGCSSSQLIMFSCPRFYEGIDRSKKAASISYINANKQSGKNIAVNVYKTDSILYLGWLPDFQTTQYAGKIKFWLEFNGDSESGKPYLWKSMPAELKIEEGLTVDDSPIIERYPTIIEDIQLQLVNASENLINHDTNPDSHINLQAKIRDFSSNPIDLETEVTGVLSIDKVDVSSLDIPTAIDNHNNDGTAHNDIRDEIDDKIETAFHGINLTQFKSDFDVIKNVVDATDLSQLKSDFNTLKTFLDGIDLVQFKTDFNIMRALVDEVDLTDMKAKVDALS